MALLGGFSPETITLGKSRKDKEFNVLRGDLEHAFRTNPSGTAFLQGTVVDLDGTTGLLKIAASGGGFGFALQSLKDMSTANGYRNLNTTDANLGDFIGVQFGIGVCRTMIHEGSGNPGDYCYWDGSTLQFVTSVPSGCKALGRLLHKDGTDTTALVSGTAGSYTTASSVKAVVYFNIPTVQTQWA